MQIKESRERIVAAVQYLMNFPAVPGHQAREWAIMLESLTMVNHALVQAEILESAKQKKEAES